MDKDEFARRAREATQSLYRVACAYLASPPDRDDAVQEALLRAWEKRRTLREEQYFKTWLTRILIRVNVPELITDRIVMVFDEKGGFHRHERNLSFLSLLFNLRRNVFFYCRMDQAVELHELFLIVKNEFSQFLTVNALIPS